MLSRYLSRRFGTDLWAGTRLDHEKFPAGGPRIAYSHNGANFLDGLDPEDELVASPALWAGRKVLLLTQDPRDDCIRLLPRKVPREELRRHARRLPAGRV